MAVGRFRLCRRDRLTLRRGLWSVAGGLGWRPAPRANARVEALFTPLKADAKELRLSHPLVRSGPNVPAPAGDRHCRCACVRDRAPPWFTPSTPPCVRDQVRFRSSRNERLPQVRIRQPSHRRSHHFVFRVGSENRRDLVIGHREAPPARIGANRRRFYRTFDAQEMHAGRQRWPDGQNLSGNLEN